MDRNFINSYEGIKSLNLIDWKARYALMIPLTFPKKSFTIKPLLNSIKNYILG